MERRLVGLPGSGAKAYLARALSSGKGLPPGLDLTWGSGPEVKQVRLVVVAADQEEAEDVADGWQALAPLLGEPHAPAALFGEDERGRLASLEQLKQGAVLGAPFPQRKIDDLISRRVSDMFKLVEAQLKKIGKNELLPAGVVLTGGGSSVQTISDLAKAVLRLPSRVASLSEGVGSKVHLKDGSWAVAYGLTIWGFNQGEDAEMTSGAGMRDALRMLVRWLQKFLP